MMPWWWLFWRASALIVRTPAYWIATGAHVVVLAAFLLVWGEGVPVLDGSVFQQLAGIQAATLAAFLPWTAARCGSMSRLSTTRASTTMAVPPSRLLLARAASLTLALGALALAGLPMLLLAQQISALPLGEVASSLIPIASMIGFVAVLTTWCDVLIPDRMGAWLAAAGCTVFLFAVFAPAARTAAFAIGITAGLAGLAGAADRLLRYLPDRMMRTTDV
jgi:hypothetical protein